MFCWYFPQVVLAIISFKLGQVLQNMITTVSVLPGL